MATSTTDAALNAELACLSLFAHGFVAFPHYLLNLFRSSFDEVCESAFASALVHVALVPPQQHLCRCRTRIGSTCQPISCGVRIPDQLGVGRQASNIPTS